MRRGALSWRNPSILSNCHCVQTWRPVNELGHGCRRRGWSWTLTPAYAILSRQCWKSMRHNGTIFWQETSINWQFRRPWTRPQKDQSLNQLWRNVRLQQRALKPTNLKVIHPTHFTSHNPTHQSMQRMIHIVLPQLWLLAIYSCSHSWFWA